MGLKQYVPAYLGTELNDWDLLTGVSFASGGCGFDPLTSDLVVSGPCPHIRYPLPRWNSQLGRPLVFS
jgi:hypothetical protein